MKTSTKRLLAVAMLTVATLCASPTDARRVGATASQTARKSVPLNIKAPTTIDVDRTNGKITGMTAVMKERG
jgi:hypothetical protein